MILKNLYSNKGVALNGKLKNPCVFELQHRSMRRGNARKFNFRGFMKTQSPSLNAGFMQTKAAADWEVGIQYGI